MNQMDITCTFCLTGTKPDDTGHLLGKREALEQLDEYADEENADEENQSSDTTEEDEDLISHESENHMNGLQNKFKLVKKSDDDIDLNFKDVDASEHSEEKDLQSNHRVEVNSKSQKCPVSVQQVNGSAMHPREHLEASVEASEKDSSTSTPLKKMDQNSEYFTAQMNGSKSYQPEEAKPVLQSEFKPQPISQASMATEL